MDNKKYLVDGQPVTPSELIRLAADLDDSFARDWLKETSVAAFILRDYGYTVSGNPSYSAESE